MTRLPNRTACTASALVATLATLGAQEATPQRAPRIEAGSMSNQNRGDLDEWVVTGGARYVDPRVGLDVRCDRAMLVLDRPTAIAALRTLERDPGLPRRGPELPGPRRALGEDVLRARLNGFLAAFRSRPLAPSAFDLDVETIRSVYLEGDVAVVQDGVEVLRADSVYYSPADDRAVLRGVLLRLRDTDRTGRALQVTLRTDELVRQGGRFVGRDVSVTTSPAGEPQFQLLSGEVEIQERADAFEIRARDNVLALARTRVLPLPDQHFFTDEQTPFPIKSASVGYSGKEGARVQVAVGGTFNEFGGAVHETLTGRPREEFRGDWELGLGWVESRGFPLEGKLGYRATDAYFGDALGFYLDDNGENLRDIRDNIDGTPIDQHQRHTVWTEDRFLLGDHTRLDATIFDASDPAVWSEFYSNRYYEDERPESSLHLRHAEDNWLATATGRWNLTGFSYADGRQLDTRFVEELPYLTLDWFSQPVLELPGGAPLTLTSSSGIAQLRSNYDDLFVGAIDDETWRLDQDVELAAPFHAGPFGIRPYTGARFTYYENTVDATAADRWAFDAGVEIGSRLTKNWSWVGDDGSSQALRHVVSPTVRFDHRFRVDGDPSDYYQFDDVDAIDEGARIRVGLLQRFQRRFTDAAGERDVREVLWFDLAQNFMPIADRDNNGDRLGLFEFEFLLRPMELGENVSFGVGTEGEQDWNTNELRTFNNFVQVRTVDVTWVAQYRSDRTDSGQVGYGVKVPVRGRWELYGNGVYDLSDHQSVSYATRLLREDLDWRIAIGLRYDAVTDDTSFRVEFEPKFGGLFSRRDRWSVDGFEFQDDQPLRY